MIRYLWISLTQQLPDDWRPDNDMSVWIDKRNRPEPAVLVVDADAQDYVPDDVWLVVEVVSPESVERDHEVATGLTVRIRAEPGTAAPWSG